MKILTSTLIAASLVMGAAPAFAGDGDNPSYAAHQRMVDLWIATGDPAYARAANVPPVVNQAKEHVDLN